MSTKKPLTKIYEEIVESVNIPADENGVCTLEEAGLKAPFTIKQKALVIPTKEWLKNPDWEQTIPFHPLSENTQRKKSVVLERLTLLVSNRLYQVGTSLLHFIFDLAVNTDKHKSLTPEQRDVLRLVPQADARSLTDITKLITKSLTFKGDNAFVNLFIKRNGLWKGEEYPRVTTVFFPLADYEMNKDRVIMDVPFRIKDRDALFAVLRFIFPKFDTAGDDYSYGSRSSVAPNFHSLMMAFGGLLIETNRVAKIFMNGFETDMEKIYTNVSWMKDMPNLLEYRNDIDPLDGNIGEANEGELAKTKERVERKEQAKERKDISRSIENGQRSFFGSRDKDSRPINLLAGREERLREDRLGASSFFRRRDDRRDDRRDERDDRRSSSGFIRRTDSRDDRDDYRDDRRDDRGGASSFFRSDRRRDGGRFS